MYCLTKKKLKKWKCLELTTNDYYLRERLKMMSTISHWYRLVGKKRSTKIEFYEKATKRKQRKSCNWKWRRKCINIKQRPVIASISFSTKAVHSVLLACVFNHNFRLRFWPGNVHERSLPSVVSWINSITSHFFPNTINTQKKHKNHTFSWGSRGFRLLPPWKHSYRVRLFHLFF